MGKHRSRLFIVLALLFPLLIPSTTLAQDTPSDPYQALDSYIDDMIGANNLFWQEWFSNHNLASPQVVYITIDIGEQLTDTCGIEVITADHPNAYYCPDEIGIGDDGIARQGIIVLPMTTLLRLWSGIVFTSGNSLQPGDYSVGFVIAHEFAHHVVDEMAIQSNYPHPTGKNRELIADCLAGVVSYSTFIALEDGDEEEAYAAQALMGDKIAGSSSPHGTAEERQQAFYNGMNAAFSQSSEDAVATCGVLYWE